MSASRSRFVLLVALFGCVAALLVALVVGSSSEADNAPSPPSPAFSGPATGNEIPELRTESSRTYRKADGTYQAQIWASPVNYRDAHGDWKPIDTDLTSDGNGGLETTDAAAAVSLPESLADPTKVTAGSRWVSFTLDGAAQDATPVADGPTATYDDVLDGVDAAYKAQPLGVKETLTLADATAPATYHYTLDASAGLTPELRDDGAVAFRDANGVTRFWLPAPTVQENGADSPTAEHVVYRLSADKQTLTVAVDPDWLAAAAFPVKIDPSIWYGDNWSCTLASATPDTPACGGTTLKLGHDSGGIYRTALSFPDIGTAVPRTASVMNATIGLYFESQVGTNSSTPVTVSGLSKLLGSGATWNKYDNSTSPTHPWTTPGGDIVSDPQAATSTLYSSWADGWVNFNVSRLAERWLRSPSTNNGVLIRAQAETGTNTVLNFDGHTWDHGGPTIRIDFEWHPGFESDQTFESVGFDGNSKIAVNAATGNVAVDSTDINLPGVGGLNLKVRRTFNGQDLGDGNGMFGSGWVESINNAAFVNDRVWWDDSRTIYANGNGIYRFDRDPIHDTGSTKAYLSPPNINADLTADQSTDVATLTFRDTGVTWTYSPSFDGHHVALSKVSDAAGHHIDIAPNSSNPAKIGTITDANGDVLTFVYGTNNQLLKITKGATEWKYTTTIVNTHNLLTGYINPSNQTTTYHYDAAALPDTWDKLDRVTSRDNQIFSLVYGPQGDWSQVTQITQDFPDARPDSITKFDYKAAAGTGHACVSPVSNSPYPNNVVFDRTVTTDAAGHLTTYCYNTSAQVIQAWRPWDTTVRNTRIGLEKFWDYDSVDTGAGSRLMVNAETGNLLWHDVPIVNPGRGLSTFVNLDYNSLDSPPRLGEQQALDPLGPVALNDPVSYNIAGRGASLGASGPTRLNEPLSGVGLADVRDGKLAGGVPAGLPSTIGNDITMTDADGTRHHFTRDTVNTQKWIAPPGVHLTLRRWAYTGDGITQPYWVMSRPDGVAHFYDQLGYLIRTEDRNGNALTYTYEKYDLLTGQSGTSASSCTIAQMLGSVSGTPTSGNAWGLQVPLTQSVTTSAAGKLCTLRATKVTDAAGRDLVFSYTSRVGADQTRLDTRLAAVISGGSGLTVQTLLTQAATTLTDLGTLMRPTPLSKITDHAAREYVFGYDANKQLTSFNEVDNAETLAPTGDHSRRWAFDYLPGEDPNAPMRLHDVIEHRDNGEADRLTTVAYQTHSGTPTGGEVAALVPDTITDRRGKVTSYGFTDYGASDRTMTVTDARGQQFKHHTDAYGRPVEIVDPNNISTTLEWDTDPAVTDRHNDLTRVSEGVLKNGSGVVTDQGAPSRMTYDSMSGLLKTQTTYPDGDDTTPHKATARTTTLSYLLSTGKSALRPATDPNTNFVADLTGVENPRTAPGGSAKVGWKFDVDSATGNVNWRQDQDGGPKSYTDYCVAADGATCPVGQVKAETDELGNVTTYNDYDANGQPKTVIDPKGNPQSTRDTGYPTPPSPNTATATAHRWRYRYDEVGNVLAEVDPRNTQTTPDNTYTTRFTYDGFDRAIQKITPKKSASGQYITENYTYDRNGNLVGDTNPGTGRTTVAAFSATDQPLTVTQTGWARTGSDPRGNTYTTRPEVTTFSYDDTDLLVSRTDPRGAGGVPAGGGSPSLPYTTEWTRDPAGRIVAESRHATSTVHVQSFALDPRGNIVGQNDAARNNDPDGNPATADALTPQAAADAAASAIALNQLSKLRTSMAYDRVDELLSQTERPAPTDATGSPRTNRYTYDVDGNLVKQVLPRDDHDVPTGFTSGAGNVAKTYTYDHRDQLLTTVDPTGATSAIKRRADGKVIAQTTPRGVANGTTETDGSYRYFTTRYAYDQTGDLLTRSVPFSPNQYSRTGDANNDYKSWKVSYTRDEVGNPTTIVDGRNKSITNTFLDSGQLESTSRPSWWSLTWGGANGAPDPGRRYTDPTTADQLPVGGPQVDERPTPLTGVDTSSDQSQSTAQGKFGAVTPADAPSWLPRGGATLLSYDDDGHLTSVTDAALSVSRIDYDPTGRIVGTTQPLGASAGATLAAGDPTPCTRTTAGCDGVIAHRYDYDLDGNTTKSSLLGDTSWHSDLTYDSFDRAVDRTDPGASGVPSSWASFSDTREETQYVYDANDNLLTRVTPRGVASATVGDFEYNYDYDTLDRLIGETNPEGDRWGYAWDVDDELLRELTPNGSVAAPANQDDYKTLRAYDAADRLLTEQGPIVGGVRNTSTYTYFQDGTMASRTDPGGASTDGGSDVARLTSYDYDGRGLRNRTTQGHAASGGFSTAGTGPRTTLTEYDANSNLRRVVDPSGVTMSGTGASQSWAPTNPDVIGDNLTSTTSTDAVHATVYDYTDRANSYSAGESGEPTAIYEPRSGTSDSVYAEKVDYDPLDRTRTIWTVDNVNAGSPFSIHSSYDRLLNGWISGSQDFATATVQINSNTYNYDQAGSQLSWKLDPDVTTTANKISSIGREYWPNGEMKTRTGSALVGTTTVGTPRSYSYWYDPNESLVGVHDPAHSRMTYTDRDGAGRASSVVQRYGTGSSDENAGTLTWQRGRDSAFSYDHDGNVTLRRVNGTLNRSDGTMADPAGGAPRSYTRFTYDTDDKETIGAFYEPSKLTGSPAIDDNTCVAGGSPPAGVRCVRTTYHPSGQRRTRRQQDDTLVTTYFDDFGQPTERRRRPTGASDILTSYSYDIRGNRLSDTPGVGTYTYNARDQLASWKRGTDFNANGVDHHDWTIDYTRNPDGSIEHTTEKQAGGSLVQTKTYSYTGQRLDNVKDTVPGVTTPTWDVYGYNEFRSTVEVQTNVSSATAPTLTVPTAVKSEDCSSTLPTTASDTTLYCHDEFDRLTRQRSPGAAEQQQFEYDGMDRRDNRTDHVGGTTDKSGYKYIGATSSISGQQVATGATTSSAMSYDRDSANAPLAVTLQATGSSTQTTKTFATDANGNPTGLEESNGTVPGANRYVYDPYGDLDVDANAGMSGDAATNPLRFNGFDYDSAVKTYDMQARDYRPSVGRFLQSDRYESAQSDLSLVASPLTQNRYDFAGADPVDSVEFDGHIPGAGSGCQPRCGDNQGGNMATNKSGDSTNQATPAASGSRQPKALDNPAANQVVKSSTPAAKAAAAAKYQRAVRATQETVKRACLERCTDEERAKDISQVAGAAALGLDAGTVVRTLDLQGMDRPIAGAEPDDSIFNPVNLLTDVATGGAAIGVKAGVEALLQRGARAGTKAAAAKAGDEAAPGLPRLVGDAPRGSVRPDQVHGLDEALGYAKRNGGRIRRDAAEFRNEQGLLPPGTYQEWTVRTPGVAGRGARRLVYDRQADRAFYSWNHYDDFMEVSLP